jgi:hypothetical protein
MTRSFPKDTLANVTLWALMALPKTLTLLEDPYSQWHRHGLLFNVTLGWTVGCWGVLIYHLYTKWGTLVAQYRPQELFRDRVLTWEEVWITGFAGLSAMWFLWEWRPRQTWMGPWDEVTRVVFALLLVIGAIPGIVHMWVTFKNRRFRLGKLPSKIG